MKSRIARVILVAMLLVIGYGKASAGGIQTDPTLTGAITLQMETLKKIFAKRDSTQKKIVAAEAAVTLAMDRMHRVEERVLDYMSNVQAGFQNLYSLKRAGELVAIDIPHNMDLVRQSIKIGGVQGTVMATAVGEELANVTLEMMSLYPFLEQLVTSGTINTTDEDGNTVKKKVNLLDSSERYYICNTVVGKLENINTDLYLLAWEIQTMRWRDLFYALDPDGWINYMSGRNIVEGIISDWNYNMRYW